MGTAPRLARILSKRRRVLDAVLAPGFFGSLPSARDLAPLLPLSWKVPTTSRKRWIARA